MGFAHTHTSDYKPPFYSQNPNLCTTTTIYPLKLQLVSGTKNLLIDCALSFPPTRLEPFFVLLHTIPLSLWGYITGVNFTLFWHGGPSHAHTHTSYPIAKKMQWRFIFLGSLTFFSFWTCFIFLAFLHSWSIIYRRTRDKERKTGNFFYFLSLLRVLFLQKKKMISLYLFFFGWGDCLVSFILFDAGYVSSLDRCFLFSFSDLSISPRFLF